MLSSSEGREMVRNGRGKEMSVITVCGGEEGARDWLQSGTCEDNIRGRMARFKERERG